MFAQIFSLVSLYCCLVDCNISISKAYCVLGCNVFLKETIFNRNIFVFCTLKHFYSRIFRCLVIRELVFINLHVRECVDIHGSSCIISKISIKFNSPCLHICILFKLNCSSSPSLIVLEESKLKIHSTSLAINNSSICSRVIFKHRCVIIEICFLCEPKYSTKIRCTAHSHLIIS